MLIKSDIAYYYAKLAIVISLTAWRTYIRCASVCNQQINERVVSVMA